MMKEVNVSPEALASNKTPSAKPAHRTKSGSEAVRCEGEVERDLTDAPSSVSNILTRYAA